MSLKTAGLALYPIGLSVLGLAVLFLVLGVALPAVWSSKPARRRAASTVLAQILTAIRRPCSP